MRDIMLNKRTRVITLFLVFVLTFALNFTNVFAESNLKAHFTDVDQADSILIQKPNSKNILIDAGETKE